MELVFEFIAELLLDGTMELATNRKVSKYIRYPLLVLIATFFLAVIIAIIYLGVLSIHKNLLLAIILIAIGLLLLVLSIRKLINTYKSIKRTKVIKI